MRLEIKLFFVLVLAGNDAQAPESMELLAKWSEMKDISEWQSGNPTQSPSLSSFSCMRMVFMILGRNLCAIKNE